MNKVGPITVEEVIACFFELGSEVQVGAVKQRVIKRRGRIPAQYKDEKSCKETIQRIIENHCPESDNYREERIAYFRRVERGVYQILPKSEWLYKAVAAKPKTPKGAILKREDAKRHMSRYYQEHKSELPSSITQEREKILGLIESGVPVEEAFLGCVNA